MTAEQNSSSSDKKLVWLASYPKSGNTWTRILLSNLLNHDEDAWGEHIELAGSISSNRPRFDNMTGLPSSDLDDDEIDLLRPDIYRALSAQTEQTLFVKVHDAYYENLDGQPIFPADVTQAAIYLVRDPRDVAISYSYHCGHDNFSNTVDVMNDSEHALAGSGKNQLRQYMGRWSDHYLGWVRQTAIPLLVIRYEDMLADTCRELKNIAMFLSLEQAGDDARIAGAVERTRFDKLQAKEERDGFHEKSERSEKFFRSGRSGEGRERLLVEDQNCIIENHHDVMRELGYDTARTGE